MLGTQRTFLPARTVWGKPQLLFCWGLVEMPGWAHGRDCWTQKPFLVLSFSRQDWAAWISSSPCSFYRDWQAPGVGSCGSKTAVSCRAEHVAIEVPASVQSSSTHRAWATHPERLRPPCKPQFKKSSLNLQFKSQISSTNAQNLVSSFL